METAIVSKTGKLVSTLVPEKDYARADTRLKQYEAYFNNKGVEIAKGLVRKRIESEISLMEIYDLDPSRLEHSLFQLDFEGERVDEIRADIQGLEGRRARACDSNWLSAASSSTSIHSPRTLWRSTSTNCFSFTLSDASTCPRGKPSMSTRKRLW